MDGVCTDLEEKNYLLYQHELNLKENSWMLGVLVLLDKKVHILIQHNIENSILMECSAAHDFKIEGWYILFLTYLNHRKLELFLVYRRARTKSRD